MKPPTNIGPRAVLVLLTNKQMGQVISHLAAKSSIGCRPLPLRYNLAILLRNAILQLPVILGRITIEYTPKLPGWRSLTLSIPPSYIPAALPKALGV